jgi:uncharacterized Ntn-hydrolase superfamily protein
VDFALTRFLDRDVMFTETVERSGGRRAVLMITMVVLVPTLLLMPLGITTLRSNNAALWSDWTNQPVSTFSIVAFDPDRQEWGIGVASRFLAVGAVVPWASAPAGAIATQSLANTTYGPRGLELLATGMPAEDVLNQLLADDADRSSRQVGIVDRNGRAATFTGKDCKPWAGGRTGEHFACQGNLLAGPEVLEMMEKAFLNAPGPLAWKIMAALEAGERAGGDVRGKQSAAILLVREKGGYAGLNDRMIDFRVDDHAEPISELARILELRMKRPDSAPRP